ncbi:DUF4942 domain-containing protein [Lelliottia wanjuensis]|uniref:DUF4942 domain-containing protein n=1 Tax=Lelliottia wanjuensis TaxID=3050585 RepID=UPI00254B502C|nr:DUF4942 domain-containing protein [Lelliottia sp. V86_10]MDK9587279.1 DUF4942 domain-containing protein [Lelliottia sp. V86_10]
MPALSTHAEPEVLTGQHDVICSTSIERIVTVRQNTLQQIEGVINQIAEISRLTQSIGGKTALDWAMKQDFRCGCWLMEKTETAMKTITCNLDRSIWRDLMKKSGMLSLMDAQARDQWDRNLEGDDIPEISEANILSTFKQLHNSKGEVFERGVINVFRHLSWNYKSNSPCSFGRKIIINNMMKYDKWGYGLTWGWRRDQLVDLERMLHLLDGKPVPDNRADIACRLSSHFQQNPHCQNFDDEYVSIRYFQRGSAHVTFKRPDLMEKMNDIIAKHYPGMLAAKKPDS